MRLFYPGKELMSLTPRNPFLNSLLVSFCGKLSWESPAKSPHVLIHSPRPLCLCGEISALRFRQQNPCFGKTLSVAVDRDRTSDPGQLTSRPKQS
jgi:hypothetical protein